MASPLAMALLQAQAGSGAPAPNVAQVAPTNYIGANSDYNSAMEAQYAAKLGQQNAMWGGLAGLGGAGILAGGNYLAKNPSALSGLFSSASTPAAGAPLSLAAPTSGGLDALAYGGGSAGAPLSLAAPGAVATADAGADAAVDAGTSALADAGGSDVLASLLALFAA